MNAFIILAAAAFVCLAYFAYRVERDARKAGRAPGGTTEDLPPMRLALLRVSPDQLAPFGPERVEEAARLAAEAERPPAPFGPAVERLAEAA